MLLFFFLFSFALPQKCPHVSSSDLVDPLFLCVRQKKTPQQAPGSKAHPPPHYLPPSNRYNAPPPSSPAHTHSRFFFLRFLSYPLCYCEIFCAVSGPHTLLLSPLLTCFWVLPHRSLSFTVTTAPSSCPTLGSGHCLFLDRRLQTSTTHTHTLVAASITAHRPHTHSPPPPICVTCAYSFPPSPLSCVLTTRRPFFFRFLCCLQDSRKLSPTALPSPLPISFCILLPGHSPGHQNLWIFLFIYSYIDYCFPRSQKKERKKMTSEEENERMNERKRGRKKRSNNAKTLNPKQNKQTPPQCVLSLRDKTN